jgi:hypothetical protein
MQLGLNSRLSELRRPVCSCFGIHCSNAGLILCVSVQLGSGVEVSLQVQAHPPSPACCDGSVCLCVWGAVVLLGQFRDASWPPSTIVALMRAHLLILQD